MTTTTQQTDGVAQLTAQLQAVIDNVDSNIVETPKFKTEQTLVIFNKKNNRYFSGFKVDATPKWSKDVFKAHLFPHPNQFNVELKMQTRCLINTGVLKEDLQNLVFEHKIGLDHIDVGSITREEWSKKTDLDKI